MTQDFKLIQHPSNYQDNMIISQLVLPNTVVLKLHIFPESRLPNFHWTCLTSMYPTTSHRRYI